MTSRRLSFYKVEAGNYQVSTFAGTPLGEVRRLTGPQGGCWRAVTPTGSHLPIDFTSRQDAGEALFQEAEDRSRAARDADLGRTGPSPAWTFYVDVQDNEENCLVITAEAADGVARGEFSFRWVDLDGSPCPCPRLEAYQDGWKVLHVSGLLPFMALWAEDISMATVIGCLRALGFVIRRDQPIESTQIEWTDGTLARPRSPQRPV